MAGVLERMHPGPRQRAAEAIEEVAVEYEVANVVDPLFTVVAKLRKAYLRAR